MKDLFKIGEVSKLCDISIKTLRFYEEKKLISPLKVDIYTGYRYYDLENLNTIYKIKVLKELGFSLEEISQFDNKSLDVKYSQIKDQIQQLNKKLRTISYLNKQKGDRKMKPFINDEQAIGKWDYECSALSKEDYLAGKFYEDKDVLIKNFYFLPNGKGYWIFEKWTKGEICHFRGRVYPYEISNNKLFIQIYNSNNEYEITLVFQKANDKEYIIDDIRIKDNTDVSFITDEKAIGFWKTYGLIDYEEKNNFKPQNKTIDELFVKSISLSPNGEAIIETTDGYSKILWTKNSIVDKHVKTNSEYVIKEINNELYLIMDWKSGDYVFGGIINCCYVFKKVK